MQLLKCSVNGKLQYIYQQVSNIPSLFRTNCEIRNWS